MNLAADANANTDEAVAEAVDAFVEEMRLGRVPDVDVFLQQFPGIAPILRTVLPAIRTMHCPADEENSVSSVPGISGTLGDFRILKELGRGGMGVVYEAEQISLGRRVALKTLPMASAIDPVRLNRFRNEAQAAAQLHHPNIVPVYAVGTERGVWYYAMQIVDGRTLAELIAAIRSARAVSQSASASTRGVGESTNKLFKTASGLSDATYFDGVMQLCYQVAQALEHAHRMDIVHRDIKPGNLILDGHGKLFVTDFGLARFRNEDALTLSGDVVGTLAYMSPEQARGDNAVVDHRSDVYSLGATLYELVTLRRPFEEENRAAILGRILEGSPVGPRQIDPAIPVDVETIILKCMSPETSTRYRTIAELAHDIERFLDDRPILARRPTLTDRFFRWCRKRRGVVATSLAAGLALCVALCVSNIAIAAEKARTEAALRKLSSRQASLRIALEREDRLSNKTEAALALAEDNFQQARSVLDFFVGSVNEDLAGHPQLQPTRTKLLQASLDYYRKFTEQAEGNSRLQAELVRSRYHVARILAEVGTSPEAEEAIELALRAQEDLATSNPHDWRLARDLWSMYLQLGSFSGTEQLRLLLQPEVQDELRMRQDQVCLCYEVAEKVRTRVGSPGRDFTETRHTFHLATSEAAKAISGLLSDHQQLRLRQIVLQVSGRRAWSTPDVADQLALSPEQRQQIDQIERQTRKAIWASVGRVRHADIRQRYEEEEHQILSLLTESQKQKWSAMLGEDFPDSLRLQRRPNPFMFKPSGWLPPRPKPLSTTSGGPQ